MGTRWTVGVTISLCASMQQQLFGNRKMGTVNGRKYTSKFKGVSWDKGREKWVANIQKDRRQRHLGYFHDELAAADAYDEAGPVVRRARAA